MNFKDATLFRQAALVGGDWIEVRSDNAIAVDNPATGEVIGSVPDLGSIETKRAIAAAEVAQKEWAAHTAKERSAILRRWVELMMENQDDLGR
jgi:succinate-semialdehyde dehydrogenase / glutarate-semialdehyde dehydrogenase